MAQSKWGRRGHGPRGVRRLDGVRGKKQVWRSHVRTWSLLQAKILYWRKYLRHCWDFSGSPQWCSAREIVPSCFPLVTPLYGSPKTIAKIFAGALYQFLTVRKYTEDSDSRWRQWLTTSMTGLSQTKFLAALCYLVTKGKLSVMSLT